MSEHTPGPWEHEDGEIAHHGAIIAQVIQFHDSPCLDPDEHDMEALEVESQANGILIAAAPDLLAACKAILASIEADVVGVPNCSAIRKVEAAIALTEK